jgi:hypothetical protein
MHKIILFIMLGLFQLVAYAGDADSSRMIQSGDPQVQYDEENSPPSIYTLLAEMNSNSSQTNHLLEKIAADMAKDGCSRQLQVDTIGLVANMNRNIQIMTNIMVRMGYNIEEMSRTPKKMNDMPFMP